MRKNKDFDSVFKTGKRINGRLADLRLAANNQKESRFGFVASNSFFKPAPLRNRIKRQLREIVRQRLTEIKKGFDVVIIAKPAIRAQDFNSIAEEVEKLLKTASLI